MSAYLFLLIESDPEQEMILRSAMGDLGLRYALQVVRSGAEALEYLKSERKLPLPRMILLEWQLPDMTSLEVIEWIRQRSTLKNIPVVLLISKYLGPDIRRAYEHGATSYLTKPVQVEDFRELMKTIFMFWGGILPPKESSSNDSVPEEQG